MSMIPVQSGNVIALVAAIVLGAFVSEDGATITAATLAASSVLDLRLAFLSASFRAIDAAILNAFSFESTSW